MTIDEQIISLRKHDLLCHDSDLQIAEWLEELKVLREKAKGDKWYQQGRADAIEEFVRPILNGTLHTICRMIASGDIPKDVYQKWLSDTPIGFMTPLEIYAEILNEQLKEQTE